MLTSVKLRGVKFKFSVGERVLCYEPDPTKAKVLYESKVLDLVVSRDQRGRKAPEYLIHFFGWNSSWDRCVKEEFILPYTEENRDLQTKLAEDAALSMKGKRKSKLPPLIKETLAKKICSENESQDSKLQESSHSTSETESSDEETEREVVFNVPDVLKAQIEEDQYMITKKDKFVKLPCKTNVIMILETYVKHLAANLLCASPPKNAKNGKQFMPEDVKNKLNLCKEAMDGIRVYFDFTLPHLLLYRQEKKQYYTVGTACLPVKCGMREDNSNSIKAEVYDGPNLIDENSILNKTLAISKTKIEKESSVPSRIQRGRPTLRSHPVKQSQSPKSEKTLNGVSDIKTEPEKYQHSKKSLNRLHQEKSQKSNLKEKPKLVCTRILRSSDKQKQLEIEDFSANNACHQIKTDPLLEANLPTPSIPFEPETVIEIPMRVTRKSVQAAAAASQLSNSQQIQTAAASQLSNSQQIQAAAAASSQLSNSQQITSQPVKPPLSEKTISYCLSTSCQINNQAPPSLSLASNCLSSSNSSTHSSLSSPILKGQQYHLINNAGLLQEVMSWHMLASHLYEQIPAAPSLIYGAQHLLRLLVKLPELLSKVSITQRKLELLTSILENFLMYLAEKKDDLFLSTAYVDASEVFPETSVTAVK